MLHTRAAQEVFKQRAELSWFSAVRPAKDGITHCGCMPVHKQLMVIM